MYMNYDFDINDDNLLVCLKNNKLGRNSRINNLLKLINILKRNTIISIDGQWGCGKTVFVKQIELINKKYYTDNINLAKQSSLDEETIKTFNENHIVYYYNAWENDNHLDPLKSIIYKIINDYPNEKNQTIDGNIQIPLNFKNFLKTTTNDLFDIDKVVSYKDLVKKIYTVEEQQEALNNLIDSIIPKDKKIVIIVDELDRCNPNFAVKLIETVKHFYTNNKIIFLMVSNNSQLSHTVSKFYGEKFDGYGYLNKIYDLIVNLENVDVNTYLKNVVGRIDEGNFKDVASYEFCKYYNFSMREINRYIYTIDLLYDYYNNFDSFRDNMVLKYLFLPYCLALKIKNGHIFNEFIGGKNIDDFKKIMNSSQKILNIVNRIIKNDKSISDEEVDLNTYIENVYNEYFNNVLENEYFKQKAKNIFMEAVSLISNYSSIN